MPTHNRYRQYFQNPFFRIFCLPPEHFNGSESHPNGQKVPPDVAPQLGQWYFGRTPDAKPTKPGLPAYPLKRFGPYRSYTKALEAAQEHFKKY